MDPSDRAALIEPQIPALRRYARALVGDVDAADDLVQDCLERALSRWALRRPGDDPRPWLFAILRNLHLDRLRARRRRGVAVDLDDVATTGAAVSVAPAQEDGLSARDVVAALDLLPEEQKSLVLLVGVEDLTYEEAARVLAVPVGTVMSRLARARRRLATILETDRRPRLRRVK